MGAGPSGRPTGTPTVPLSQRHGRQRHGVGPALEASLAEATLDYGVADVATHTWVRTTTERTNLARALVKEQVSEADHTRLTVQLDADGVMAADKLAEARGALAVLDGEAGFVDAAQESFDRVRARAGDFAARREFVRRVVRRVTVERDDFGAGFSEVE